MAPVELFALASALIALATSIGSIFWILAQPSGEEAARTVAAAIRAGAAAFLRRQYQTIALVAVTLTAVLWFALGRSAAVSFLAGTALSALAGLVGMAIAVQANVRTAEAARRGLSAALTFAFRGGAVTGLLVVGLALAGLTLAYVWTRDLAPLIAMSFGASLVSVFARLGGGIYTKAADVGADLVGKVEMGIPEDDPRNPATIADNVGDNVGDDAGMAADLFETYLVTAVSAMLLGSLLFPEQANYVAYPLALGGIAALASTVGSFTVWLRRGETNIMAALYRALAIAALLAAVGFLIVTVRFGFDLRLFLTALIGLALTAVMMALTDYYTAKRFRPVRTIAEAAKVGVGPVIIHGLALGMRATALPIVAISAAMLAAFVLAGLYGIAIASFALLSLTGIVVAIDAFGPITDNAGGIAEMAKLPKSIRKVTDALDAVGNTTKAVTKAYAIASAGLAASVLFAAYVEGLPSGLATFGLQNPKVLVGLFAGGLTVYLFAALAMEAVGRAAGAVVTEVRRQFRTIKGILEGRAKPDYSQAVDIVTRAALREMVLPALLPVVLPLAVGFGLGAEALGGLLVGMIVTGLFLALAMTTGGAAWDNAKKYIEDGALGGKGSDPHKAAVVGDTVGDPYKDTAGPAINPAIKVANVVALLIAAFLTR